MTSGGKDILNVWEKSCVSGSLQSVCTEIGSFRVEFSEANIFFLLCFVCIPFPYFYSSLPFVLLLPLLCVCLCVCVRAREHALARGLVCLPYHF